MGGAQSPIARRLGRDDAKPVQDFDRQLQGVAARIDPVGQVQRVYEELELGDFEAVRPAIEDYFEKTKDYQVNRLGLEGVLIREIAPGSAAEKAGVRQGDVILEVNRHKAGSVADVQAEAKKREGSGPLLLLLKRGEASLFAALNVLMRPSSIHP